MKYSNINKEPGTLFRLLHPQMLKSMQITSLWQELALLFFLGFSYSPDKLKNGWLTQVQCNKNSLDVKLLLFLDTNSDMVLLEAGGQTILCCLFLNLERDSDISGFLSVSFHSYSLLANNSRAVGSKSNTVKCYCLKFTWVLEYIL